MTEFYNLSSGGQARRLRQMAIAAMNHYPLKVADFRALSYGDGGNAVFRVDSSDGRRYILRLSRPIAGLDMRKQVRSEMMWLSALRRDTDLGVPKPVPTRSSELSITVFADGVPEERECAVTTWVPGRIPGLRLSAKTMLRHGELSACLHNHASMFRPLGNFGLNILDKVFAYGKPSCVFEDSRTMPPSRRRVFEAVIALVQDALDRLFADRSGLCVIHNDLQRWNIKVTHEKIYAFDFEWAVWGYPVQDIATTFFYVQRRHDYGTLRDSFVRGYERYRGWPEQYPGQIDVLVASRFFFLLSWASQHLVLRESLPDVVVTQERLLREFLSKRDT